MVLYSILNGNVSSYYLNGKKLLVNIYLLIQNRLFEIIKILKIMIILASSKYAFH